MKFSKAQYKVLHMDQGNPKHKYRLDEELIENNPEQKNLGVLVDEKLNMTCQCVPTAQKASHVPDCIQSSVASRSKKERKRAKKKMSVQLFAENVYRVCSHALGMDAFALGHNLISITQTFYKVHKYKSNLGIKTYDNAQTKRKALAKEMMHGWRMRDSGNMWKQEIHRLHREVEQPLVSSLEVSKPRLGKTPHNLV
ncbi:hypothetical protein BTVI_08697 [Pitangus sulphuratus]|nr:hypothetical protein BTVI_08697 [Pitangus sulphuratus]